MKPWPLIAMENTLFADAALGWDERCSRIAEAGFDGIYAVAYPLNEEHITRMESLSIEPKRHGIRLAGFYVNIDLAHAPESPAAAELKRFCERASGIPRLEISFKCSDPAKFPTRLDDVLTARLETILKFADKNGFNVALYPHSHYPLETISHAQRLIDRIGHARLGLVFATSHIYATHNVETTLRQLRGCADKIVSFNFCGCQRVPFQTTTKCRHLPLGEGELDFAPLLNTLAAGGYRGDVILQGHGWQGDLSALLRQSVESYRQFFQAHSVSTSNENSKSTAAAGKNPW